MFFWKLYRFSFYVRTMCILNYIFVSSYVRNGVHFFPCVYSVILALFVQKPFFSLLSFLGTIVKNPLTTCVALFKNFYSVPLTINLSFNQHYAVMIAISLEIRLSLQTCFKNFLDIPMSFIFHVNFRIRLLGSD